jgi:hypothetical protein
VFGVWGVDLLSLSDVRGGKPRFVGTRITVYDVLEYLAGGMTTADIVRDFPSSLGIRARRPRVRRGFGSADSPRRREAAVRPELVRSLVGRFAEEFPDTAHVTDVGLDGD